MTVSTGTSQSSAAAGGWSAERELFVHRRHGLVTTLDPHAAAAGLAVAAETTRAAHSVDHLLGLDLGVACPAADRWLRAVDLTVVYEPADPRRLRATAMWRLHPATGAVAVWELIVSAQTAILQSDPGLAVVSDVAGDESLWAASAGRWAPTGGDAPPADTASVLVRRRGTSSVLIAVHPADVHHITVERHGDRIRIGCRLFSDAIEKGVLLRGRVLAALGPDVGDTAWADPLIAAFAASPPPLTT